MDLFAKRALEKPQHLGNLILLDGAGDGVVKGITGLGKGSLVCKFSGEWTVLGRGRIQEAHYMISQKMFQQQMEGMTMVWMSQMTQFMQEHIVLKYARKTHDAKVQIDVAFG